MYVLQSVLCKTDGSSTIEKGPLLIISLSRFLISWILFFLHIYCSMKRIKSFYVGGLQPDLGSDGS